MDCTRHSKSGKSRDDTSCAKCRRGAFQKKEAALAERAEMKLAFAASQAENQALRNQYKVA